MVILGIDPGTRCGWAVCEAPSEVICKGKDLEAVSKLARSAASISTSGVWDLAPPRGSSPGTRYLRLLSHLELVHEAYPKLALIAYEQFHQRGGAATECAAGVVTHIQSWCANYRVEHQAVHSATLKKWATGRGNADKDAMVLEAVKRLNPGFTVEFVPEGPVSPITHDEADAILIALWAAEFYVAPTEVEP